ncbi:hypothetical protein TNCV_2476971 [Trichonephila clavipes]|nr:hypothetical protein TNCV_2476971 [Trichonephila clavipes]
MLMVHDGDPPHFCAAMRDWLDSAFHDSYIGYVSPILLPPRSLDLMLQDFFPYMGNLKELVYRDTVAT